MNKKLRRNSRKRSRKNSHKRVDGSRSRIQRRSNQLKSLFSKRDSQHNSNIDLASILNNNRVFRDVADVDVHNHTQHRINPEIRGEAGRRSMRQRLRRLPGARRHTLHLADIRSNARSKAIVRRSRINNTRSRSR
jgi:hypothetical protein